MKTTKEIIEQNLGTYRWFMNAQSTTIDEHKYLIDQAQHYEGWGRCGKIIDPRSEEYQMAYDFLKSYGHKQKEIKEILSKVQSSSLTSFYTPTDVAKTITEYALFAYKSMNNGKDAETLLDPSCGTGAFLTGLEWNKTLQYVHTCEKDLITRQILQRRVNSIRRVNNYYGNIMKCSLVETRYEMMSLSVYMGGFDIIVSNMPFGDVQVYDSQIDALKEYRACQKKIHNYYFIKSMLLLKQGGIMAFITTRGFLSSPKNKVFREQMLQHGRILNIVRLPDNMFPTVDVGSDLIVYQKTNDKADVNARINRIFHLGWMEDEEDLQVSDEKGMCVPHCNKSIKKNQYGKMVQHYKYVGDNLAQDLKDLLPYGLGYNTVPSPEELLPELTPSLHYGNHFFFFFN